MKRVNIELSKMPPVFNGGKCIFYI